MSYSYDRTAASHRSGTRTYYHVTSASAADAIMREGFRVDLPRTGRDMGVGVYLNPHLEVLGQKWMSHVSDRVTIEVLAPTNVLTIDDCDPPPVYRALYGYDKGNATWEQDSKAGRFRGKTPPMIWDTVLQDRIRKAGFLGALDTSRQDNTIIFDPRHVRPVKILGATSREAR